MQSLKRERKIKENSDGRILIIKYKWFPFGISIDDNNATMHLDVVLVIID